MGSIEEFNTLSEGDATKRLYACLANQLWAEKVASGRPYSDATTFITAAWLALNDLTDADWLTAIKAHPRIGERGGHTPAASAREQNAVLQAGTDTLAALAAENQQYEAKFGYVFLIRASGRSADEIRAELRRRMSNDPSSEFREATRELVQIVEIRLNGLVSP